MTRSTSASPKACGPVTEKPFPDNACRKCGNPCYIITPRGPLCAACFRAMTVGYGGKP